MPSISNANDDRQSETTGCVIESVTPTGLSKPSCLQRTRSISGKRVTFKDIPDKTVVVTDGLEPSETQSDLVVETPAKVRAAIDLRLKGDSVPYLDLVETIQDPKTSVEMLRSYISALALNVSLLSSQFDRLVAAVLRIDWITQDEAFVCVYTRFVEDLLSASSVFVAAVARMLTSHLKKAHQRLDSESVLSRVHGMLERVLIIVPTGPSVILPVLNSHFPHKTDDIRALLSYCKSLFRIISYSPVLRHQIITILVEGMVQIDLDIQMEIEELEDDEFEAMQQEVFAIQPDDTISAYAEHFGSDSDDSDSDDDWAAMSCSAVNIKSMVMKLDALVSMMLDYVSDVSRCDDELDGLFNNLLDAFGRVIIPTHRLRYTQFILFYICSYKRKYYDLFIGTLIGLIISHKTSSNIRISAAAYIGSFVSRAKYIEISSARYSLHLLNNFIHSYLDRNEAAITSLSRPEQYTVLYSAVQAVLYIFCFRWKDLMVGDDGMPSIGQFPPEMKGFQRVLLSKFAPLRVKMRSCVSFILY